MSSFHAIKTRPLIKRAVDIVVSFFLLILLLPVFIIVSIIIKIDSNGPVFFRQERVTRNKKIFLCNKFRTMVPGTQCDRIADSKIRMGITRVGHFLRFTRLDELPQLYNVLVGDMSIVGPRPTVKRYVDMFPCDYDYILSIKPGMTGLASIKLFEKEGEVLSGGEEVYISYILPKKFRFNKFYVKNMSNRFDLKIIFLTISKLFNAYVRFIRTIL